MQKKKILFLFYRNPLKYVASNDRRQYLIFSTLSEKFDTRILSFGEVNRHVENQQIIRLKSSKVKKVIYFILKLQSPRITHYQSIEFAETFDGILKTYQPDIVYVEHLLMMQYILNIRTSAKILFFNDESNLFIAVNKLRKNLYEKIRNVGLSRMELNSCKRADHILVITKEECKFLESKGIKNISLIPYGIDIAYFPFNWQKPENRSILFLGDFSHAPNREAVKLLCKIILPALSDKEIRLKIVGRNTNRVEKYITLKTDVYENVEDVRPFYWNSSIFVAPIFSGAGLRVKVLEAATCGIPLIVTPTANLGVGLMNDQEAFVCNSTGEIIKKLREYFELTADDKLHQMRSYARNRIINNFDEQIVKNKLNESLKKVLD